MTKIKKITANNLTFDCRIAGNENDELVIFLHGFPETSFMWIDLMKSVSEQGFYCIAPNQRGYSKGATPRGKRNYALENLAEDVLAIARSEGKSRFHLIGHDWGAAIGWKVVHDHPETILSWTGMSVPHLQAFFGAIANDKDQQKKSRYIRAFQIPFLPEYNIRKNDFAIFKKLWKNSSETEVNDYLSVFRNRRNLTAALNYYRANGRLAQKASKSQILGDINVPTLFIWGEKDVAIGGVSVENGHGYMKAYYQFLQLEAGHWLVQTRYKEIEAAVIAHLNKFKG